MKYQVNKMIPLKTEVTEMAHQTPVTPVRVPKKIAKGTRKVLNDMLIIAGGVVLPKPLNIPCVVISNIMKSCENPRINRYWPPASYAALSGTKMEKMPSPKNTKTTLTMLPNAPIMSNV